jgi:hypothetical protein
MARKEYSTRRRCTARGGSHAIASLADVRAWGSCTAPHVHCGKHQRSMSCVDGCTLRVAVVALTPSSQAGWWTQLALPLTDQFRTSAESPSASSQFTMGQLLLTPFSAFRKIIFLQIGFTGPSPKSCFLCFKK